MNNKIVLSIFVSLITFVLLPQIVAVSNSEIIYESTVADFSIQGINLSEKNGEFVTANLIDLQPGDIVIFDAADESLARKVTEIKRFANKIVIDTQHPDFYDVMESYFFPEQNIKINLIDDMANSRGEIFNKSLAVRKEYSNNVGQVSFETNLNASLDLIATVDIPVKNKKGLIKIGTAFELGMTSTKLDATISKEYKSDEITLTDFNETNKVLKINTKIVTQTSATGAIKAEIQLNEKINGEVAFSAILERRWFKLPLPTKCSVTRDFKIESSESVVVEVSESTGLKQMFGINFNFSVLGLSIAEVKAKIEPYARASGNIDAQLSFEVDKDFKTSLTKSPEKIFSAECEFGVNSDTSLSLIKNLYKKDFGEKSLVVYRCAGNK